MSLLLLFGGAAPPPSIIGARFALSAVRQREFQEEEDATRQNHNSRLLFGRTSVVAAVIGAPWPLWVPKPYQAEAEEDAARPDLQRLHRYRQAFQTVGQNYRLWAPAIKPDQTLEPDAQRADHALLHRFRVGYQTVGQSWQYRVRPQAREAEEAYSTPIPVSLHVFRQPAVIAAQIGQPWYMWVRASVESPEETALTTVDHEKAFALFLRRATTIVDVPADVTGGWPIPRPRRKRKLEEPIEVEEEFDLEAAEAALLAKKQAREAERRDQRIMSQLKAIYAEQDALLAEKLALTTSKAAAEESDDIELALILAALS